MPYKGDEDMMGNLMHTEEAHEDIRDPNFDMEGHESREDVFNRYAEKRAHAFEDVIEPVLQTRERAGEILKHIPKELGETVRDLPYSRGPAAIVEGLLGRKTGHEETMGRGESLKRVIIGSALLAGDVFLRGRGQTLTGTTLGYLEGKVGEREKDGRGDERGTRILRKTTEFVRENRGSFEKTEKGVESILHGHVKRFA